MALFTGDPLSEESVRRLRVLQKHLRENVHPEDFDIGYWRCGTVACALGHACFIPEFQDAGLSMAQVDSAILEPCYHDLLGINAGEAFFDLDGREVEISDRSGLLITCTVAEALFMPGSYNDDRAAVTPERVAERIEEILNPDYPVLTW